MSIKKCLVLSIIVLLILAITLVVIIGWRNIYLRISMAKLNLLTRQENYEDLSLTIYYMDPLTLTLAPLGVKDLINSRDLVINISGSDLEKCLDSLRVITETDLTPIKPNSMLNARVYYVFKYKKRKIFDVAMWSYGSPHYILINGIAVEDNCIFYDFVRQFLPEDAPR